jgi:hypothetical protein
MDVEKIKQLIEKSEKTAIAIVGTVEIPFLIVPIVGLKKVDLNLTEEKIKNFVLGCVSISEFRKRMNKKVLQNLETEHKLSQY